MRAQTLQAVSPCAKSMVGVIMAASIILAASVDASVIEGIHFTDEMAYDGINLELKGTALLNYMVFIKAYVGAIYLPPDVRSSHALKDVPKQLVLEYFHPIGADGFRTATRKALRRNVNDETFRQIEPRLVQLNELYQDVKPNDRYSLTYVPGRGTELALNGVGLGVIPGAEFARAVFSIWIGQQPIDRGFKETILGVK